MRKPNILIALMLCISAGAIDTTAQPAPNPSPPPPPSPAPAPRPPPPPPPASVWGFVDLHAHLAAHLAYGANAQGDEGIFWGKPGLALADAARTMPTDLAACNREKHSGFDGDPVRHETRQTIMQKVNQITGATHGSSGWPSFESWPNARNGNHQQMHVAWLRRAFDGGLRVIVASAVENQTFSKLWNNGFNFTAPGIRPDPADEIASAERQLKFIEQLVAANSSWMEIVWTSEMARRAVQRNHLAVVLGLELDSLSAEQILQLKNRHHVSLVIPIHMANNSFGGTAVYGDVFNTHNYFLNREFFEVDGDPLLSFRLHKPQTPHVESSISLLDGPGSIKPTEISQGAYCALGYECCRASQRAPGCLASNLGHKNHWGLSTSKAADTAPLVRRLMREKMLIDLAHMSDKGQTAAVQLAQAHSYPMLNSHTGLREDGRPAGNERDMRASLAAALARLGGVIGLGTGGPTAGELSPDNLVFSQGTTSGGPGQSPTRYARLTGEQRTLDLAIGPREGRAADECSRVTVTLRTGGDDLRGGGDDAIMHLNVRGRWTAVPLNRGAGWSKGSVNSVVADLPAGTRMEDIADVVVQHVGGGQSGFNSPDNWDLDDVKIECGAAGATVASMRGSPLVRFTGDNTPFTIRLSGGAGAGEVRRLAVTIRTGGDDLRGGSENAVATIRAAGRDIRCDLNRRASWGDHSIHTVSCDLPAGTQRSQLESFRIKTTMSGGCCGDNWNMDAITIAAEEPMVQLLHLTGSPLVRFTLEQRQRHLYTQMKTPRLAENPAPSILRLWIRTTTDDLRGENDNAYASFEFRDGTRSPEFPLNAGGKWGNDSHYAAMMRLPAQKRWSDIRAFHMRTTFSGGPTSDNWDIGALELEAFDDPIGVWGADLARALAVMGGGKVALGTDLNGFAPQIPMTATQVTYPISYPRELLAPGGRGLSLPQHTAGRRKFHVSTDGIAHIGMLPDFLVAAAQKLGAAKVAPVFHSAEDFLKMWEKVEAAAGNVPP
jgi:microsomal dipeptidase-like Zn-dependent dipeptidase